MEHRSCVNTTGHIIFPKFFRRSGLPAFMGVRWNGYKSFQPPKLVVSYKFLLPLIIELIFFEKP